LRRVEAVGLALRVCGSSEEPTAFLRWLAIRAEVMVAGQWHRIEAVAAALIAHRTLTWETLRATILEADEIQFANGSKSERHK
jgi:hypothetical protein